MSSTVELFPRLLEILLPEGGNVIVLYEAYLDETYANDVGPIFAVGGYMFESSAAHVADLEWKRTLDEFGVDHFHMIDVANCTGDFAHLGMTRCDELARRMIGIIKRYAITGGICFTNPGRQNYAAPLGFSEDAYTRCIQQCVVGLTNRPKFWDTDPHVAFFLESGHPTAGMASSILNEDFASNREHPLIKSYSSHTFGKKKEIRLLQAADLLLWQGLQYLKGRIRGRSQPRADFRALVQGMPPDHTFVYIVSAPGELLMSREKLPPGGPNPELDKRLALMFAKRVEPSGA